MFGVEGIFLQTLGDLPVMLNSLKFLPQAQELCFGVCWSILNHHLPLHKRSDGCAENTGLGESGEQAGYWGNCRHFDLKDAEILEKPILDSRDLGIFHPAKLEVGFEKGSVISCGRSHFQLIVMVCLCGGTVKGFGDGWRDFSVKH